MKLFFHINFVTKFGESLQLVIHEEDQEPKTYDMQYAEQGNWNVEVDYFSKTLAYQYRLVNTDNQILDEEYALHHLNLSHNYQEFQIYDVWNKKNFPENYLNNKILKNKLSGFKPEKLSVLKKHTHHFRIEAPLYHPDWRLVLIGNVQALGNWEYLKTVPMKQTDFGVWETAVTIPENQLVYYKYGIMNTGTGVVFDLEYGDNRWTYANPDPNIILIKADHFFRYKAWELYHAAGVAVPVFSLRSEKGFGVGEFSDLKDLADWAKASDLGIIQILPVNDTTAHYSWTDSYPYAAISVYALHPQYVSLEDLDYKIPAKLQKEYQEEKTALNNESQIDYEKMITGKWKYLKAVFKENKEKIYKDRAFRKFLKDSESWLLPYAAFCVQRDKYRTPDFSCWKTHKKYIPGKVAAFFSPKSKDYEVTMLHAWVQYQLHLQLSAAVEYVHRLGVSLKGDLPIGIYRHSVEAWTEPELFGMDFQAGAPPDQFTDLGQNWGFPTYNWEKMKENGYQWWKNRFKALEQYFDAMRIDHILGFFRIWRIPYSATQGIMGYFYPAVPVTEDEFRMRNIPFNYERFCRPFINDQILWDFFGNEKDSISGFFMNNHFDGTYSFKEEFDTQRKLREYFDRHPHPWAEEKLISLCANVLFLTEEREGHTVYHPRFNLAKTESYRYLPDGEKHQIDELYVDYFFRRQDALWYHSAMEKLPVILNATDMLICGEDLGLVPDCVPQVMDRLGITALKVQRMPVDNSPWYNPKDASYLNVVTASSHDSSTLRQWWHENRELVMRYFHSQLNLNGTPPWDLEPEIAEVIMKQHLYNNAMLAIFPLQEYLATDRQLVNPDENAERINDPAVFPHYWRYRMHLTLNELKQHTAFSSKIKIWVQDSSRS